MLLRGLIAAVCLGLAVYDAALTWRRIGKYGLVAERNPVLVRAAQHFGVFGLYTANLIPVIALLALSLWARLDVLLGAVLGARLCLFDFQLDSLKLERAIDAQLEGRSGSPST